MEFLIIIAMIGLYSSLSSRIDRIVENTNKTKFGKGKDFPSLQELVGKNIELETNDPMAYICGNKINGILKDYNDTWIIIEITKKKKIEVYYYRLSGIKSISIIN